MIVILHNYKFYLRTGTRRPDIKAKDRNLSTYFDIDMFIRSRDSSSKQFYEELVKTQLFNDFIIHVSFLSELDPTLADGLAFFDDCCNRINPNTDRDGIKLLDLNRYSDQTVVILPPEPLLINNEQQEFLYNGLSELKIEYFNNNVHLNNDKVDKGIDDLLLSRNKLNIPIGVRSKTEKLQAQQKLDSIFSTNRSPQSWAYCLLSNTYALWFIYLPYFIESSESEVIELNKAFKVLVKIQKQMLSQPDEVSKPNLNLIFN